MNSCRFAATFVALCFQLLYSVHKSCNSVPLVVELLLHLLAYHALQQRFPSAAAISTVSVSGLCCTLVAAGDDWPLARAIQIAMVR